VKTENTDTCHTEKKQTKKKEREVAIFDVLQLTGGANFDDSHIRVCSMVCTLE
jgi:hypothetical protein